MHCLGRYRFVERHVINNKYKSAKSIVEVKCLADNDIYYKELERYRITHAILEAM